MKKLFIKIASLLLCLTMAFSFAACGFTFDGQGGQITGELTKLSVPQNISVSETEISWNSVSNADSYVVKIGNNERRTTGLTYPLSQILSESGTDLYVQVKALPSSSILYSESEWSSMFGPFSYVKSALPNQDKTPLDAPTNVAVSNDEITWSRVEGAEKYTVAVDDDYTFVTASNKCKIEKVIDYSGNIEVKVRANETNKNAASDWSQRVEYNYTSRVTEADKVELLKGFKIGRGYNLIEDDYLDTVNCASTVNVLDVGLLLAKGHLGVYSNVSNKGYAVNAASVQEYVSKTKVDFEYSSSASIDLIGKAKTTFKIDVGFDYSDYQYKNTYSYTYDVTYKNYVIDELDDASVIAECLTENFKKDINRQSPTTQNMSDDELMEYIYRVYGTHAILGVITGGKYRADYMIATNSNETNLSVKTGFNAGVSVSLFDGFVSGATEMGLNLSEDLKILNEGTTSSFNSYILGGFGGAAVTPADVESGIKEWSKSITEDNCTSVGLTKGGGISISTLIYYLDAELSRKYASYVKNKGEVEYQDLLDRYAPKTNEPEIVEPEIEDGTEAHPYLIKDLMGFYNIRNKNDSSVYYKLANDIDFGNADWKPDVELKAHIDGAGFTISNIKISSVVKGSAGLFWQNIGEIKNLNLNNVKVDVTLDDPDFIEAEAGVITGANNGIINNCKVYNSSVYLRLNKWVRTNESISAHVGGICGYSKTNVENCIVDNTIVYGLSNIKNSDATTYCDVGGVVGYGISGDIISCKVTNSKYIQAEVKGGKTWTLINWKANAFVGGIVGSKDKGQINACTEKGNRIEYAITKYDGVGNNWVNNCKRGAILGFNHGAVTLTLNSSSSLDNQVG